jgi:ABC-2 type transport system ATP-binding protein
LYDIEARGLIKSFRDVHAVDGLDVLVERGDAVALLGPNGAGKTTTLMMLLGIVTPDAGSVVLLGNRLPENRSKALAGLNFTASYVSLPYDLRVKQYLWVYADLYGVPRSRAMETLELFRIGHLADRRNTELSSGNDTRRVLMEEQARDGFTLFMTSHNMSEIERLCRRVIFLARGRAVADGTPAEIAARYGREDLEGTFLSIAEEARR